MEDKSGDKAGHKQTSWGATAEMLARAGGDLEQGPAAERQERHVRRVVGARLATS